jgi:hypothetical protein
VTITIDQNGLHGHDHHSGDLIPAPSGGCPASDPDCDETGLPCSSIPMAPSHRWALLATVIGSIGFGLWLGRRKRHGDA